MPSALETLVKILKLEREQGYKNTAVMGGLSAYTQHWQTTAHEQARKPEHHQLVDEIGARLHVYDELANRNERHSVVSYVLDRIIGRIPAPDQGSSAKETRAEKAVQNDIEEKAPPKPARQSKSVPENTQPKEPQARAERKERPPKKSKKEVGSKPNDRKQRSPAGQAAQEQESAPQEIGGREDHHTALDYIGEVKTPAKNDLPQPSKLERPPRRPRPKFDPGQVEDILRGLQASVDKLRRIGPTGAARLNKLGVRTVDDFLQLFPRRYDDYTQILPIARLAPNVQATVIGAVRSAEIRAGRDGRKDFHVVVDDGTGMMSVTFFRQYYLQARIRPRMQLVLRGVTSVYRNQLQLTNPEFEELDPKDLQLARIVPVYSLTENLTMGRLRGWTEEVVNEWADRIPDYVPEATLERVDLADLGWAIRQLHYPESWDHLHHAKRRYIFDQLLLLQLAVLANRRQWQATPSQTLAVDPSWLDEFISTVFPYPLTGAQQRALADIRADIAKPIPMNRLLQGDVGSGKTAVAATAMAMAFSTGKQAALMAPTSILAEQHYRNLSQMLAKTPGETQPTVALLTSAVPTAERERVYAGLADGSINMVIGTHALIQEGVEFADLALVIVDEQHRFGVEQRKALRNKGSNPHLLFMTATPIPRTLALTIHADLDLSIMDEMPPGRIPVKTRVISPAAREKSYEFIERQLNEGRQAFIVYPLVEASDHIEAEAATDAFQNLQKVFYRHRVGLLHGRMRPAEKDQVMADFAAHQFDVMVTTSVAEVGVDIPNASVIMIENANRFGLAQLHQLRGRVGRGGHASYCLLICDTDENNARERLTAMEMFNDGFKLAEIDWKLRGAGDLIGTRQSGQSSLRLADDISPELVELAQREARTIFEEDPDLVQEQHRLLARRVVLLRDERSDLS